MDVAFPPTPALVVDLAVLERNVTAMAGRAAGAGVALRPHVKTHKTVEIARLQQTAGATGITVATLGEAEVYVRAGFEDVFVAYPLWLDEARGRRLAALRERAEVRIGIDSLESAARVAATSRGTTVLVEVDSGHHRTGVVPAAAGELAAGAARLGLNVAGVFTFPGHSYAPDGRRAAADDEVRALEEASASLRSAGIEPLVVSGGASPSAQWLDGSVLTEARPGAYVFQDAQQWELGACEREDIALTAHATVVSHAGGRLVLDAGSKSLGADRAPWASGYGRLLDEPQARIVQLSEHHAVCELPAGSLPELGSTVRVVPNHCCNAVNLADRLVVVGPDGSVEDEWRVAARGRND